MGGACERDADTLRLQVGADVEDIYYLNAVRGCSCSRLLAQRPRRLTPAAGRAHGSAGSRPQRQR